MYNQSLFFSLVRENESLAITKVQRKVKEQN